MDGQKLISIEGNIGVGKTTFIKKLKTHINGDYIEEPVDEWCQIIDPESKNNFLKIFYEDKKRWGYTFQNMAYITRMQKIISTLKNTKNKYIFTDRSVETDMNVFACMLRDDGNISNVEWEIYEKWNKFYHQNFEIKNKKIIYLRCHPDTAQNRIIERGRDEEKGISIEYLTNLHLYHEKWIATQPDHKNILILDCDQDFEHHSDIFDTYLTCIKQFIDE